MKANPVTLAGVLLAISAFVGTGLMVLTQHHAVPYIEVAERETLMRTLNQLIPANRYDNALPDDTRDVVDPVNLGSNQALRIYRARKRGQPAGAILTVIAPDGYGGPIRILVGVDEQGTVLAVRVVHHNETPGLGDGIEVVRSNWIKGFEQRSLDNPAPGRWRVKKDGGEFDQFTGATITPRAVVGAVHRALDYYRAHREEIYADLPVGDNRHSDPEPRS